MVKFTCAKIPLPGTKITIRGEINSLNFYRPIVTEEYITKEDTETTKKRLFFAYFQWVLIILIGALAGLLSTLLLVYTNIIENFKRDLVKYLSRTKLEDNYFFLLLNWIAWTSIPTCLTSVIVVYVQPLAEGTGIETIIAFLNGVAIPKFGQLQSIIMKIFCILLISIANLPGGCEEPLVHVVTMIGVFLTKIRIPFTDLHPLQNDVSQRDLAAVGCGAGIAAVFGTPIGGTLFALELMTYWSPTITFYIFISSLCAAFINRTLSIAYQDVLETAEFEHMTFFRPLNENITKFSQAEIPIYVLMGLCIGFCGAIWNYVQVYLNAFRKRFIKYKWLKVLEAVTFTILLNVATYLIVVERHDACFPMYRIGKENQSMEELCADEENRISSFLFESHSGAFNTILFLEEGFVDVTLLFYFLGFSEAAVFQLGLHVPTGIIASTMISGALMGRLISHLLRVILPSSSGWAHIGKLAYLGAVAHTSGVTHLRFSVGVIMIEAVGNPLFGLPVFLIIFVTNWVVEFVNYPIFHLLVKFKGLPVLDPEFMPLVPTVTAADMMTKEVVCLPLTINPKALFEFVQTHPYLGFPIVNSRNIVKASEGTATKTIGFVYRNDIFRLLNPDVRQSFSSASVRKISSYKETLPDISFSYLMDPNPLKIKKNTSLSRAYELFVTLGLQHLLVVDNQNYLVGLITRKDLAAVRFDMFFFNTRISRARVVYSKDED